MKRRSAIKPPRLRILVVSEGAKTEGLYLSLFIRDLRAANVQIDMMGRECGSDPLTVVEFAKSKFVSDSGYDLCYCLIDRDSHPEPRFSAAISLAREINSKYKDRYFHAIVSDPCIEFWFILHFKYSRAPFVAQGNKSRADIAVDELKKHLPDYRKSSKDSLSKIIPKTRAAIDNANKAQIDAERTNEPNPSTAMHIVADRVLKESGN